MSDETKAPRLSVSDVAAQLGIARQSVLKHLAQGTLRGYRYPGAHRGTWRIAQADVDAFMRRAQNVIEPRDVRRA